MESELTPGDAAPIYLRLAAGVTADAMSKLATQPRAWLELPFDQFPAKDAAFFPGRLAQQTGEARNTDRIAKRAHGITA